MYLHNVDSHPIVRFYRIVKQWQALFHPFERKLPRRLFNETLVACDLEISPCFTRGSPFGAVQGSLSDFLGLRPPLPRSRPAQISEGTLDSTEQLKL